jgi:O-antigen ligase
MGFAGAVGMVAGPCVLALILLGGIGGRMWPMALAAIPIAVGVITSQGRSVLLGTLFALIVFLALSITTRAATRVLGGVTVLAILGAIVLPMFVSGSERYESIGPTKVIATAYNYRSDDLASLGEIATTFPFGAGLGTVGPARSFGGPPKNAANGETQFNYLLIEIGIAGMLLVTFLMIKIMARAIVRIRRIEDIELRLYQAAIFAPFITIFFMGLGGPTTTAPPFGPWVWLAAGIAAYWFFEPRRPRPFRAAAAHIGGR